VLAHLDNATVFEDDDLVALRNGGIPDSKSAIATSSHTVHSEHMRYLDNRGQAVRNRDRRSTSGDILERGLDIAFCVGIERAGSL